MGAHSMAAPRAATPIGCPDKSRCYSPLLTILCSQQVLGFCTSVISLHAMVLRLAVAMLLGIGSAGAQQNASAMKALREKLLGEKSDMDPRVPPSTSPGQDNKVWVQFRIFKVLGVDLQSGRLRFKAWRRTRWFDDRLAWDPVSAWLPCAREHRTGQLTSCVHRHSGGFRRSQEDARLSGKCSGHKLGQQAVAAGHSHVR